MMWEYRTQSKEGGELSDWAAYNGPGRTRTAVHAEISKLYPDRVVAYLRAFKPHSRRSTHLHIRLTPKQKQDLEELAWMDNQTVTQYVISKLGLPR